MNLGHLSSLLLCLIYFCTSSQSPTQSTEKEPASTNTSSATLTAFRTNVRLLRRLRRRRFTNTEQPSISSSWPSTKAQSTLHSSHISSSSSPNTTEEPTTSRWWPTTGAQSTLQSTNTTLFWLSQTTTEEPSASRLWFTTETQLIPQSTTAPYWWFHTTTEPEPTVSRRWLTINTQTTPPSTTSTLLWSQTTTVEPSASRTWLTTNTQSTPQSSTSTPLRWSPTTTKPTASRLWPSTKAQSTPQSTTSTTSNKRSTTTEQPTTFRWMPTKRAQPITTAPSRRGPTTKQPRHVETTSNKRSTTTEQPTTFRWMPTKRVQSITSAPSRRGPTTKQPRHVEKTENPRNVAKTEQPRYEKGTVRLFGGISTNEGLVEILYKNRWSSVCSDFWNVNAANLVCHELGFDKADTLRTPAYFSPFRPAPSTWFSNFNCNGDENSLSQCIYTISNTETCSGRDVGVVCVSNEKENTGDGTEVHVGDGREVHVGDGTGGHFGDNTRVNTGDQTGDSTASSTSVNIVVIAVGGIVPLVGISLIVAIGSFICRHLRQRRSLNVEACSASTTNPQFELAVCPPAQSEPSLQIPAVHSAPSSQTPPTQSEPAAPIPPTQSRPSFQIPPTQSRPFFQIPQTQAEPSFQIPPMQSVPSAQIPPTQSAAPFQMPLAQSASSIQTQSHGPDPSLDIYSSYCPERHDSNQPRAYYAYAQDRPGSLQQQPIVFPPPFQEQSFINN